MNNGITLEELLGWDEETSAFWNKRLEANPALLALPCDIGDSANVQQLVRHIWSSQLRWAERLAALPVTARENIPAGPLDRLFDVHRDAVEVFRRLLAGPADRWSESFAIDWIGPKPWTVSRRKAAAHTLLHSQRHWAQLATLVRTAGFPSGFRGDLLVSSALE
jgi:uncharacterized damage-inducible protein DinB